MTDKKKILCETMLHAVKVACELNGYDVERCVLKIILADVKNQKTQPMTLVGGDVPADKLQEIEMAMLESHIRTVESLYPGSVSTSVIEVEGNETKH